MFKNALLFRIDPTWVPDAAEMEEALGRWRFTPCGATQAQASGWVEPRGQAHGPLLEVVGRQWFLRLGVETRLLPSSVVRRKLQERMVQVEHETGRRPGKRQQRDLKDDIILELLPRAFTRLEWVSVWIDPTRRWMVIDATSSARAEEVLYALSQSLGSFPVSAFDTVQAPASWMADCLLAEEPPAGFSIDRDCELKSAQDDRAAVRYVRHPLDSDEVRAHLSQGKQPTRLALTFASRLSFILTERLQIKRLEWVDGVMDEPPGKGSDDPFDANAVLVSGELGALLEALVDALGGMSEGLPAAQGQVGAPLVDRPKSSPGAAQGKATASGSPTGDAGHPSGDALPPWDV